MHRVTRRTSLVYTSLSFFIVSALYLNLSLGHHKNTHGPTYQFASCLI